MDFAQLKTLVRIESDNNDFIDASKKIESAVSTINQVDLITIVNSIGAIPEDIKHDSSEEKLYSKLSDCVLARCFQILGLKARVLQERANSADVFAESPIHGYTLIGDAKVFRLSRTAKNQKDFKVQSMVHWKGDNDFAILVCPYFQYPTSKSQIYGQALDGNVCLFSWEHLSILLSMNICESKNINLSSLWNFSGYHGNHTTVSEKNLCFLNQQDSFFIKQTKLSKKAFEKYLSSFKESIAQLGETEISYWQSYIDKIKGYSHEEAISELIKSLKINEKISAIQKYVDSLKG